MKPLYEINRNTMVDEFDVDHSKFSLRDEIEYNFNRAKERNQGILPINTSNNITSPWYRKTYDKVYQEANKLHDLDLNDKYKHAVVSCVGAQDGIYGTAVTGAMSIGKEIKDIGKKFYQQWNGTRDWDGYGSILKDSGKDLVADAIGLYKGITNPQDNCYNLMKPYYKPRK